MCAVQIYCLRGRSDEEKMKISNKMTRLDHKFFKRMNQINCTYCDDILFLV